MGVLRRLWAPLLLIILSVTVALALVEVGLRLSGWRPAFQETERVVPGTPRPLGSRTLHIHTVIRHRTGEFDVTYRSNAVGYFDREWSIAPPPGGLRLAFLGDSFTMGHGVAAESTFVRLLEAPLAARWDRDVETMNFGLWGSGTRQELESVPDVLTFSPNLVCLCVYINDVFDNTKHASPDAASPTPAEPATSAQRIGRALRRWVRQSPFRVVAFVSERTRNLRGALGLIDFDLERVFRGQADPLIEETASLINQMAARLRERDIPLVVIYLPARIQLREDAPRGFDPERPNRILADRIEGATWCDLTDDFRSTDARDLWFAEGHFTPRGHRFVAERLAERLPDRFR